MFFICVEALSCKILVRPRVMIPRRLLATGEKLFPYVSLRVKHFGTDLHLVRIILHRLFTAVELSTVSKFSKDKIGRFILTSKILRADQVNTVYTVYYVVHIIDTIKRVHLVCLENLNIIHVQTCWSVYGTF